MPFKGNLMHDANVHFFLLIENNFPQDGINPSNCVKGQAQADEKAGLIQSYVIALKKHAVSKLGVRRGVQTAS